MADTRAIMAVGEAVANLLRAAYDPVDFPSPLEFRTITAREFGADQVAAGVSIFLYRVTLNGTHRIPPGRFDAEGRRRRTQLPVDLHFLLSIWGREATLQHAIAGWAMRVLEDTPLIPAGALNAAVPGCFRADETVELIPAELSNEDLFRIWEVLGLNLYQLSIPYLARTVRIESTETLPARADSEVQERAPDMGLARAAEALGS